jgi:DNA-binding XRE family transcriptional regulator
MCRTRQTRENGLAMAEAGNDGLADYGILSRPSPCPFMKRGVTMPVRRYRKDPRSTEERHADESVLRLFEQGDFLQVEPALEREAIEYVQRRHKARREVVAALGKELGVLRRAHGLTQEQVACALGTKKSNISRLESGRYGGLTVEYFLAILDTFRVLGRAELKTPAGKSSAARP